MNETVLEIYYLAKRNKYYINYELRTYEIFIQNNPHLSLLTQQNLLERER